ncbi:MAG: oxidative damage protection protein [Gammaproteobacteria bacterium RIFCSPHIGHO2_12_FULL_45_12]|nr:MAG: oxidative damage protection protein [Gammaproteobacteria bacterium RIFCSPHIGHO2_12_FULL_45_12]
MSRLIHCVKLDKEAEGLEQPPLPGEIGVRIYEHISSQAWEMWLTHQTMLINEYRLSLIDPKSRTFLLKEMEKFLFGGGSEKPAGYVPNESSSS